MVGTMFRLIFRLPRLAALPVVLGTGFLVNYLLYHFFMEKITPCPMDAGDVFKYFAIDYSVPLGIYWWITEGPGAAWVGRRFRKPVSEPSRSPTPHF
jgi:hypothetical protein